MSASGEYQQYFEEIASQPEVVPVKRVATKKAKAVSAQKHHGEKKGCHGPVVVAERIKVCEKVEKVHQEKRYRTVVDYRTEIRKVEIVVQEVKIRTEERCKPCNNDYCTRKCKWVDVCVNGKEKQECEKKGCCSGKWIAARQKKICWEEKVCCPGEVKYCVDVPFVVCRKECVEVEVRVACFRKECYNVPVKICETECKWIEKKCHDLPQAGCPTC